MIKLYRTIFILLWVLLSILGAQASSLHPEKASQTIYHDADHPSHILLPIIPEKE